MRQLLASSAFVLTLGVTTLPAADTPQPGRVPGLSYRMQPVADGVFCATASNMPYYIANSAVIVGSDSVLVVDTGAGPNEAAVLRESIRKVTPLPVRYVVDTHFHFDHAFGHQAFPDALVIGHDATRALLGPDALRGRTVAGYIAGLPAQIEGARMDAAKAADPDKRRELTQRVDALSAYQAELLALVPTPPQLTFGDRLTLWLGRREVQILHLGRGHTAGDIVVYLPQQRVVCTGDLFNGYIGYMGDAYVNEWADTLDRLAELDFETIIPGHGAPFKGKDKVAPVQSCLRDLWRQAESLKRDGVSVEEAARRIDLRSHAADFPRFGQAGFDATAVRRIYEVINERGARNR